MVIKRDYTKEAVEAAHSVLIEVFHLMGEYRDSIVLVGGWVPEILFREKKEPYVGSMDVDIALDHREITEEGYRTISQLLLDRGYEQGMQPFIFKKEVRIGDSVISVEVDLLSGEYEGTGKAHRHQRIQDVMARKAKGCDLAFELNEKVFIEGTLPGGGKDRIKIRVASLVPFFTMKGFAMDDRLKEKDSWDIYYCIVNYPGGLDALVELFKPYRDNKLVKEGLKLLGKHFSSEKSVGPKYVADFEEVADDEERNRIQRDAYERVRYLLTELGIVQDAD